MSSRPSLLPVQDAITQIISAMQVMPDETLPLSEAYNRILAEDIRAKINHPPADVSAMDGYAGRSEDFNKIPVTLRQVGESAAGHPYDGFVSAGCVVRIFTGAHLPDGTDSIIIQEDTQTDGDSITVNQPPKKGQYIRQSGQDFKTGEIIAPKGMRLDARRLSLIASAGHGDVLVKKQPVIAVISTGDELVDPGIEPQHGQIVASNGIFLTHMIKTIGAIPLDLGQIPDQDDAIKAAFDKAQEADLIVTTGGASVGAHDGVAQHMSGSSGLAFWRIAMRPGKPLIFGKIGHTPMLGLPGNPVSTGVCALVFVQAAIKAMLGQDPWPQHQNAKLMVALKANDKRQDYLRASLSINETGQCEVTPFQAQDSGMMKRFADADALIIRAPFADPAETGDIVQIMQIPPYI